MNEPKLFYGMAEIAAAQGKTTEAARTWFVRNGLAKKVRGRWFVTAGRLLAELPELFQRLTGHQSRREPTEADTLT